MAQRLGFEEDPALLVSAMAGVAALAGAGRSLLERWRRVAETLGGGLGGAVFAPGAMRFTGEHLGRQLVVETTTEPPGVRLTRSLGTRDAVRFELADGARLSSLTEASRLFPSTGAETRWAAVQPARFVCDGETATLSWEGYLPDAARVTEAAALLAALEAEPAGPYR